MSTTSTDPVAALAELSCGTFLLTAAFDETQSGVLARSVQPCADDPPLLCVALRTGHPIEPIIRDSRHFAICQIDPADRLTVRKFSSDAHVHDESPFAAIPIETLVTGSPVLCRSRLVFDCEVVRHFDLEAESELYIGQVLACRAATGG